VQAAPPVRNAFAECGELQLSLADADENERRSIPARGAVYFELDVEARNAHEDPDRRRCGGESVAEQSLELFARAHQLHVRADGARVEEEVPVHVADVGAHRDRGIGRNLARGRQVVGNSEVTRKVIQRAAGDDP
jgi:hypothetical protein